MLFLQKCVSFVLVWVMQKKQQLGTGKFIWEVIPKKVKKIRQEKGKANTKVVLINK